MLKFGIHSKDQLTASHLEGFFKRRKCIALDLYNALEGRSSIERDWIQERMLSRFANGNGTFRYTYTGRFEDFDTVTVKSIASNFSRSRKIRIHDVGASDGRTSCQLYEYLDGVYGTSLDFLASDREPFLYLLRRKHSSLRLIVDGRDNVLQITAPPFVLNVIRPETESKLRYPVNHFARYLLLKLYVPKLLGSYRANHSDVERSKIELMCDACRVKVASKTNFRFQTYDVLTEPTECFDVIRAMNVLNPSYFDQRQLRTAVWNLIHSLKDGGLFVIGSNVEAGTTVNGGIYQKNGDHLELRVTSGTGSQIDALVRAVRVTDGSGKNAA